MHKPIKHRTDTSQKVTHTQIEVTTAWSFHTVRNCA